MEEETVLDTLQGAVHVSSAKQVLPVEDIPSAVSVMEAGEIENRGVGSIKDFTDVMPNLYIPDYGSSMTSSVYLRGFGSRMDNPVMGLYVDDVPIMNKNAYDFDFYDISGAVLMRGPQSTLYGRNSDKGFGRVRKRQYFQAEMLCLFPGRGRFFGWLQTFGRVLSQ